MQNNLDMCASNRPSTPVLGEFHWQLGLDKWAAAPDALLAQTGCCYEGQGVVRTNKIKKKLIINVFDGQISLSNELRLSYIVSEPN